MSYKVLQMEEASTSEAQDSPGLHDTPTFKAHIDWKFIASNLDEVKKNVAQRNSSADPELVVELYDRWRLLQDEVETLRSQRNENAKAMKVPAEINPRHCCKLSATMFLPLCCHKLKWEDSR
jgi:Seryl-tRNA synthetase N-terminal domain